MIGQLAQALSSQNVALVLPQGLFLFFSPYNLQIRLVPPLGIRQKEFLSIHCTYPF